MPALLVDNLVTISYDTLMRGSENDLFASIQQAYGDGGLGVLTVSGVPGYPELRKRLLPLAQKFASLPGKVKSQYEDEASGYQTGWSHGKEMLQGGQPDIHKGSFYANPLHDRAPRIDQGSTATIYPTFHRPNIWPSEYLPDLEAAFKELGQLIIEVGMRLLEQCERYVKRQLDTCQCDLNLVASVRRSTVPKARLLHYFPPDDNAVRIMQDHSRTQRGLDDVARSDQRLPGEGRQSEGEGEDVAGSWCGWHHDHGSLTGLTSSMYIREEDGHHVPSPDVTAGLYIRTRHGPVVKVNIPEDHIAYQLGEVAQIQSGGVLKATPHCVVAPSGPCSRGISRNTFAVFMQPDAGEVLVVPSGVGQEEVGVASWQPGQTFGDFSQVMFKKYYG